MKATKGAVLAMALLLARKVAADGFVYLDFNATTGLALVGDAATSSCEEDQGDVDLDQPGYGYADLHGKQFPQEVLENIGDTLEDTVLERIETDSQNDETDVEKNLAGFGHRESGFMGSYVKRDPSDCSVRLKLTTSNPNKASAVWKEDGAAVLQGFSTKFSFKISDLSKACSIVRDASFSTRKYQSCSVHGGDGFAFVIHGDSRRENTIGDGAEQLGFGGIENGLAVEFDIWYNPDKGDLLEDHVTIFANGLGKLEGSSSDELVSPRPHRIGDGKVHTAKIVYFPFLNTNLLSAFTASNHAIQFMKDNGEGYRLGTLAVWMDDSVDPLLAVPINLSKVLDLEGDIAFVGFTGSTGRSWASQDILSWQFCETYDDIECVGAP